MAELDTHQVQAVAALEKALKRCERYGVALVGMDESLLAFDKDTLRDRHGGNLSEGNRYQILIDMQQAEELYDVQDHGAYLDSGGW